MRRIALAAGAADVVSHRGLRHSHRPGARLDALDGHHGVRSSGMAAPVEIRIAVPGSTFSRADARRETRPPRAARRRRPRPAAIHRRAVERRHVERAADVLLEDSPERLLERDLLGGRRLDGGEDGFRAHRRSGAGRPPAAILAVCSPCLLKRLTRTATRPAIKVPMQVAMSLRRSVRNVDNGLAGRR